MLNTMKTGLVVFVSITSIFCILTVLIVTPPMEINIPQVQRPPSLAEQTAELRNSNEELVREWIKIKDTKLPQSLEHERLRRKLELDVHEFGYYLQSRVASSMDSLVKNREHLLSLSKEVIEQLNQTVHHLKKNISSLEGNETVQDLARSAIGALYQTIDKVKGNMDSLAKVNENVKTQTRRETGELNETVDSIKGYIASAKSDLNSFEDLDKEWRDEKLANLSKSIQAKIYQIMNPENCQEKAKFFCDFETFCGFGCEIHHVMHCLKTALYYGRPLVLISKKWTYSPGGWQRTFKPISVTCENVKFNAKTDERLPIIHHWGSRDKKHFSLAIPEELLSALVHIHGNPAVWWNGQLLKYVWRHQPFLNDHVSDVKKKIGFKTPIVGIQVRRTDKLISEAASFPIEEYMKLADEFYDVLELKEKVDKRRVYLATDEPQVVRKARQIYPQYEIINDPGILQLAGRDKRYGFPALLAVVTDIHLLAESDFLVCTFSSNIGRIVHELRQTIYGDASLKARSIDVVYWNYGQNDHMVRATQRHVPRGPGELSLNAGDEIALQKNFWNGTSRGRHAITGKTGNFPSYKVEDTVRRAKYSVQFLQT